MEAEKPEINPMSPRIIDSRMLEKIENLSATEFIRNAALKEIRENIRGLEFAIKNGVPDNQEKRFKRGLEKMREAEKSVEKAVF